MSKHLIVLLGPTQSGKTSSIKMALHQLHLLEPELEFRGKNWVECLEVLLLHDKRIGVTSRSDKYSSLLQNIALLEEEHKCDVIICAANEMMKGVKELLQEYQNKGWQLTKVQKYPVFFSRENKENQSLLNQRAADKLIEKFNQSNL
jgi:ABC-type multidrug transport system ATPase subunit